MKVDSPSSHLLKGEKDQKKEVKKYGDTCNEPELEASRRADKNLTIHRPLEQTLIQREFASILIISSLLLG